MIDLNKSIQILTKNGYIVSFEVCKEDMPTVVYKMWATHRSVKKRFSIEGIELNEVARRLVDFVKKSAPLDFGDNK